MGPTVSLHNTVNVQPGIAKIEPGLPAGWPPMQFVNPQMLTPAMNPVSQFQASQQMLRLQQAAQAATTCGMSSNVLANVGATPTPVTIKPEPSTIKMPVVSLGNLTGPAITKMSIPIPQQ